jgi:hypothetical protein
MIYAELSQDAQQQMFVTMAMYRNASWTMEIAYAKHVLHSQFVSLKSAKTEQKQNVFIKMETVHAQHVLHSQHVNQLNAKTVHSLNVL